MIEGDVDLPPDAEATKPQEANDAARLSLRRSGTSFHIIQCQPAPTPATPGARMAVPTTLAWSDFRPVTNRINGMSAQTGYRWRASGTAITVAFDPSASWSVLADQTTALLRHEQYHMNLAVLIANKANAAAGTMGAAALIKAFQTALETHERVYDADTDHGRNTRLQSFWEQDIDAGVPEFPWPRQ